MKPIHKIFISVLLILLSRYVFEYIDPWLGWLSYLLSAYLLVTSIVKLLKQNHFIDGDNEKQNNQVK